MSRAFKYKKGDLVKPKWIALRRGVILKTRVQKDLLGLGINLYRIKWTDYDFIRWHQEQDICLVQSVRGNK